MSEFTPVEVSHIQNAKLTLLSLFTPRFEQLPMSLQMLLEKGILTGGATASVMQNGIPNDYDIYLTDKEHIEAFKSLLHNNDVLEFVKDISESYKANIQVNGKLITANATTFNNGIQVITCADAKSREKFDYIHCMPWYDIKNDKLYISPQQFNAIKTKKLIINPKAKNPPTAYRRQKYIERGWRE